VTLLLLLSCKWAQYDLFFPVGATENGALTDGFVWTVVVADTSLYIPGFHEQPVSVTALGVDSNGRTTWQIQPGKPTGTIPPAPFPITGKFVATHHGVPARTVGGGVSGPQNLRKGG